MIRLYNVRIHNWYLLIHGPQVKKTHLLRFFFLIFIFKKIFIVVQVQLSPFSHHHFPPLHPPHLPPSILSTHLSLSMGLCTCSLMTLSVLSPVIPSYLPSGYCQFVLYFNVSGYILLACLFC